MQEAEICASVEGAVETGRGSDGEDDMLHWRFGGGKRRGEGAVVDGEDIAGLEGEVGLDECCCFVDGGERGGGARAHLSPNHRETISAV